MTSPRKRWTHLTRAQRSRIVGTGLFMAAGLGIGLRPFFTRPPASIRPIPEHHQQNAPTRTSFPSTSKTSQNPTHQSITRASEKRRIGRNRSTILNANKIDGLRFNLPGIYNTINGFRMIQSRYPKQWLQFNAVGKRGNYAWEKIVQPGDLLEVKRIKSSGRLNKRSDYVIFLGTTNEGRPRLKWVTLSVDPEQPNEAEELFYEHSVQQVNRPAWK